MRAIATVLAALLCLFVARSNAQEVAEQLVPLITLDGEGVEQRMSAWMAMSTEFNDRLLSTVNFSLGAVVTLVVSVLALNFFTGQRAYEKDKQSLQESLRAELEKEIAALKSELNETNSIARAEMMAITTRLQESFTTELGAALEKIRGEVASVKKESSEEVERLGKTVFESLASAKVDALEMRARYWDDVVDVPNNALRNWTDAVQTALDADVWFYQGHLNEILSVLEKATPDPEDRAAVTKMANDLPPKYGSAKSRILAALAEKAV